MNFELIPHDDPRFVPAPRGRKAAEPDPHALLVADTLVDLGNRLSDPNDSSPMINLGTPSVQLFPGDDAKKKRAAKHAAFVQSVRKIVELKRNDLSVQGRTRVDMKGDIYYFVYVTKVRPGQPT